MPKIKRFQGSNVPLGERIVRNTDFLCALAKTRSPKERCHIIESATDDQIGSIVDVCASYLCRIPKLTKCQHDNLCQFQKEIEDLCNIDTRAQALKIIQRGEGVKENLCAKRRCQQFKVVQMGKGFLPALLVPIVAELITRAATHYIPKLFK